GIAVMSHAQRVDAMLPCIVVTAFRDLDLAMKAMQAGAVAFLPKPFKAEHLLTIVARALERRELAAEALRLRFLAPMLERFTMVLANTLESKDVGTQRHANRLVYLSDAIAGHLGLPADLRAAVRYGACLHDIGKVAIPEELLRKPAQLTDEERAVVRTHPVVGASILEDIETWHDVRLIVRHHHEHYDGAGYPDGLRGTQIPLGARIVSVVDAFDVMRFGRLGLDQRLTQQRNTAAVGRLEGDVGALLELRHRVADRDADLRRLDHGQVVLAVAHRDCGREGLAEVAQRRGQPGRLAHAPRQ